MSSGGTAAEAAARFTEFGELDLPRFQVGFPPQHLLLTLLLPPRSPRFKLKLAALSLAYAQLSTFRIQIGDTLPYQPVDKVGRPDIRYIM